MGVLGALRYDPVSNDNQAIVTNPMILEGDSHVHVDGTRNLLDLSGPVTGDAWIVKSGGGALWLSGEGAGFSGGIDVMTGALNVSGNFAGTLVALRQEAVLEGSGRVGPIGGNGTVAPGPGPSVLAADSAGARNYVFQFSRTAPDYAAPAGSGNDVLRLTRNSPFPVAFTGANRIALYFNVGTIRSGDIFRGGFFTDSEDDFLPRIHSAQWTFYVADPDGPDEYEGQTYRIFDGDIEPVVDTVTETADFGLGPVSGRSLRIRFGDAVTSFETWRAANFLPPALNDPEISGPSADPLEMGVPNLLRYAWGLTFDEPVQGALPEMRLLGGAVEFSFRMAPENTDLAHLVFVSEDLKEWRVVFDSDQEPALVVDEGRLRLVFALEDSNGEQVPARFFRLGVLLKEQI
jgi:hypothetical protein